MRWGVGRWQAEGVLRELGPRPRRRNPLLVPWRWRWEILLGAGVPLAVSGLVRAWGPAWVTVVSAALVVAAVLVPAARRFLGRRVRSVVVQHRLRVGMVEAGVLSWSGRLPAILHARGTDRGVRVVLWCPAGVDVHAFHGTRALLASACWATDVDVARHPRWSNVVSLVVVS
jgi:hypothetical protein